MRGWREPRAARRNFGNFGRGERVRLVHWTHGVTIGVLVCLAPGFAHRLAAEAVAPDILAVVEIHGDPVAQGSEIHLGDIAQVTTSDERLRGSLVGLRIGRAAPPGETREVYVESIRVRLRQQALPVGAIEIRAPERIIRVRTAARPLETDRIVEAIERAIRGVWGGGADSLAVVLEHAPEVLLGSGEVELDVPRPPERWSDPMLISVDIRRDGVLLRSVTARVRVQGERPVLVATRDIGAGETIGPEDVAVERRPFGSGVERWLRALDGDWRTVRPIRQGEPVESRSIEPLPDLIRGESVPLVAVSEGISVRALGVALADGFYGQIVRVRNAQSDEIVEGVLSEDGTVRVRAW